jgi:hypothetical protein
MTYAIKQLTEALQELNNKKVQFESKSPEPVSLDDLKLSKEVDSFIEQKRDYSNSTRSVSVGTY